MSTQSIIHKTCENVSEEADKVIMCMADKYVLKTAFMVGSGYDKQDFIELEWLDRLLCEGNCSLEEHASAIKEKIRRLTIKYL